MDRLRAAGVSFKANDNIHAHLEPGDLANIQLGAEQAIGQLLAALAIDTENDHNTRETAARVAKMYVQEVFCGRYAAPPKVTDFPNDKHLDELYTLGPIAVRSACSHHLVPITGHAWVGVIPGDRVIGISKFNRLVRHVLSRPQIQEEAVVMVADEIERLIKPLGFAIVIRATHMCMTWRGVRESDTSMTTSVMRGLLREDPKARSEFMQLIAGQGY